jgi:hypothetical protein
MADFFLDPDWTQLSVSFPRPHNCRLYDVREFDCIFLPDSYVYMASCALIVLHKLRGLNLDHRHCHKVVAAGYPAARSSSVTA